MMDQKERVLDVVPAYGRSYTSKEEIQKDLLAMRDFAMRNSPRVGPYVNLEDLVRYEVRFVRVYSAKDNHTTPEVFAVQDLAKLTDKL